MILWFTVVQVVVAAAVGLYALVRGLMKRPPDDIAVLGTGLIELLLVVQVVIALIAPAVGNPATGDALEFWMYLITALLLPVIGIVLAFVERSRWSTVVLGVAALGLAVMVWRMQVIWGG